MAWISIALLISMNTALSEPGDHYRTLQVDERDRDYLLHIPESYDPMSPTPVVLILHGAGTDADITVKFTGMTAKSEEAGFIAVYPNGTGRKPLYHWNAGGESTPFRANDADDVKYISCVLDDVESIVNVDRQRVFATGMSNGGMMCYRLADEMSDRIAAIAPVAGTMIIEEADPPRPVPVLHFQGMDDRLVPPDGPGKWTPKFLSFKSLDETVSIWCRVNGCPDSPEVFKLPKLKKDGTSVTRKTYGPGLADSEVIVYEIAGGGHTWPGEVSPFKLLGRSTFDIKANDLIWEFFQRHPMPATP